MFGMHVLSDLHRKGVSFRHWPCVTLYTSELPGHSRIAVKYLCLCTVLCLVSRGPLAIRRVMARLSLAFDHHSSCVGRGVEVGLKSSQPMCISTLVTRVVVTALTPPQTMQWALGSGFALSSPPPASHGHQPPSSRDGVLVFL